MKRKLALYGTFMLLVLVLIVGTGIWLSFKNPLLDAVVQALGDDRVTLLSPLKVWIEHLGEPLTVPQLDDGTTIYYWPSRGIAVFTHPHYQDQYRRIDRLERQVTFIMLPLQQKIHPPLGITAPEVTLNYETLLNVQLQGQSLHKIPMAQVMQQYLFSCSLGPDTIGLGNLPLLTCLDPIATLHLQQGRIEQITFNGFRIWYFLAYD